MSVSAPVTMMPLEVVAPYTDARDAYQLALAEGFVGTREEWLVSLKGDKGDPGTPGASGSSKPWEIAGCVGGFDFRDVQLNGSRVMQVNDKSGNGKHWTHATDATRAIWTERGMFPQGGIYSVAGGGIAGVSSVAGTVVWIGADWTTQNPSTSPVNGSGAVFLEAGLRLQAYGCYAAQSNATTYNPPLLLAPAGAPSIYAQIYEAARSSFFVNGIQTFKGPMTAASPAITKIFGSTDGVSTPFFRLTQGLYFFNRPLTSSEVVSIAAYYGAPTSPPSTVVYSFGSSTPAGQASGEFQKGCVALFANAIGAHQSTYAVGGERWNIQADSFATSGLQLLRGTQNTHIIMPQGNDLAAKVPVATCETSITNHINRVRASDPFGGILLVPPTPRNSTFTNGQTYDGFDTDRLALIAFMEATASASAGIVCCDVMSIPNLCNKGDEANPLYFNPDKLHLNEAGHVQLGLSLFRGRQKLWQGA
ncbi:SGNH/GDSL hydrolase family protein [Luteolibacter luteus]|uniref:SGNH hydrolase-type esterase domain-containing protein n=1 Tax=Luteolibacter luteus TaxID=2728835 RepID=A0A858RHI2_9BACT|nr:SGNH/GDSL hydrolase family protein [Luteolibacter luteus]QJE95968.1 hypothetical protein HHL09_09295 [Luteolibacter luteus]